MLAHELTGKTALITGASRGIGAATAISLAQNGVSRLMLHYNTGADEAEGTAEAVRKTGAQVDLVQADLGGKAGIDSLIATIKNSKRGFDILVNNAGGLVKRAKLLEFTESAYDHVMNLNVKCVWFLTQAVVPAMIERKSGVIINVSSIAARNGGGLGATVYASAKAAISAMTKGMAKELAPQGIRVNAVSPGTVDNDFHQKYSTKQLLDAARATIPAGSLGTNEEIADTILFLSTNGGRYIHGQTIEINGGQFMI
jgi:3-oxoacyl-[acyl-carrier protein] reductase